MNNLLANAGSGGVLMKYKVLPFDPVSRRVASSADVARQLENLIAKQASEGWEFVRLETISAILPERTGFLGFFREGRSEAFYGVAVFRSPRASSL